MNTTKINTIKNPFLRTVVLVAVYAAVSFFWVALILSTGGFGLIIPIIMAGQKRKARFQQDALRQRMMMEAMYAQQAQAQAFYAHQMNVSHNR